MRSALLPEARSHLTLHFQLGLQALDVAEDRGDSQRPPFAFEAQKAVLGTNVSINRDLVPLFGMADIVDGNVVMLAPEERHGDEFLAMAEHVERRCLPLPLGNDPMLDPNVVATVRIWPARNVAGRENPRCARFQKRVHHDTAIDAKPGPFGKPLSLIHI